MNLFNRYNGVIVAAIVALWVGLAWVQPAYNGPVNWDKVATYPTLHGGRIKPLDSLARQSLLSFYGKQTLKTASQNIQPIPWFFELVGEQELAKTRPVFRVDHPGVLHHIDRTIESGKYISYNDLLPARGTLVNQASQMYSIEPQNRTAYERAVITITNRMQTFESLQKLTPVFPIPRPGFWNRLIDDIVQNLEVGERPELALHYLGVFETLGQKNWDATNTHIDHMSQHYDTLDETVLLKSKIEKKANQTQFFLKALSLYLLVFVLVMVSWLQFPILLKWGYALLTAAFSLHSIGLILRMWLHGRPPVTNLYSSAVFVGWVAILLCLIVEKRFKNGVGQWVAAVTGFLTLIIAHHLAIQGDTLEMMQAVLDSNFWLATHVITINIGYAGTLVMGMIAHLYVIRRLRGTADSSWERPLAQMAFGSLCFGVLFMVVGTLLGGIWADQSWGRFWGWDPKENGALLIILVQALILHARWGGMIKNRGMMVWAIIANMVTAFSWFGVNMLGIGLHSYGFMDSAFFWLIAYLLVEAVFVWLAFFPVRQSKAS